MSADQPDPYSRGAQVYRELGWRGVIPCDVDGKPGSGKVPEGFTGRKNSGVWPSDQQVAAWALASGYQLGLRLEEDQLGIDVDYPEWLDGWTHEEDQDTGEQLRDLPPLPPAWSSTSRGPTDGRRKYVYHAELPPGREWAGFGGGQLLHHGHRYVRAWPSVNQRTKQPELWYTPDGKLSPHPPRPDELTELSPEWIEALTRPISTSTALDLTGDGDEFDWHLALTPHGVYDSGGEQQTTLHRAAWSLSGQRGISDRLAVQLLERVVACFVDKEEADPWTPEDAREMWLRMKRERAIQELPEAYRAFAKTVLGWQPPRLLEPEGFTDAAGNELPPAVVERATTLAVDARARELVQEWQLAQVRGERPKRTAAAFVDLPQTTPVIADVLAAEVNLLGGPQEAGKSLLARDWAIAVATGQPWRGYLPLEVRNVLWVASEGLHDFRERWAGQPGWGCAEHCPADCAAEHAADRVFVLDQPVNLVLSGDVDWLLTEYAEERPGLVVFDVIYGMGLADDNGVKDVLPVLSSLKRLSQEWSCATLALGHPGHNGERRLRGSSMWRNLAYTEWHLADGSLTCEKSKLADKRRLGARYRVEYPSLYWLDASEALAESAGRDAVVRQDFEEYPSSTDSDRARRLAPLLDVSERSARRMSATVRQRLSEEPD